MIIKESYDQTADAVLLTGDTLEIIKTLPADTFNLIVTSPPYNLGKVYEKETSLRDYLNWQKIIITELYRVLNSNGSIVWQSGNYINKGEVFPLDIYFYRLFKELKLYLRNRIIWHFGHGLHCSKRFSGRYETLLWFTKSNDYTFNLDDVRVPSKYPGKIHYKGINKGKLSGNPLGKNPSDYWEIIAKEFDDGIFDIPNVKSNHPEKTAHPCSFPIELIERCVLAFTNENDFILDPFGGSGSSLIAALKQNRRGVSIDKEKDYINITKERIAELCDGSLKTREIGTPICTPTGKQARIPFQWGFTK